MAAETNAVASSIFKPCFTEAATVLDLLRQLTTPAEFSNGKTENVDEEVAWQRVVDQLHEEDKKRDTIIKIVKPYAEQPKLLDSHLETIISEIVLPFIRRLEHLSQINQKGQKFSLLVSRSATLCEEDERVPRLLTPTNVGAQQLSTLRLAQDLNAFSSLLYTFCLVRKPKAIIQYFPTDVVYLEFVLSCLEQLVTPAEQLSSHAELAEPPLISLQGVAACQDFTLLRDHQDTPWMLAYVLLQWLGLLVLVPFKISSFGTRFRRYAPEDPGAEVTVFHRVFYVQQQCLKHPSPAMQQATASLAAKLFSRPDMAQTEFPYMFGLCCRSVFEQTSDEQRCSTNSISGSLQSISTLRVLKAVLKTASPNNLAVLIPLLSDQLLDADSFEAFSSSNVPVQLQKYHVSAVGYFLKRQLPPQFAAWRYRQEKRGLFGAPLDDSSASLESSFDASFFSPKLQEKCELVLDYLLQRLESSTLSLRWVAAKRLALIVQHLPVALAQEVTLSVIHLLQFANAGIDPQIAASTGVSMRHEEACNGACLALAELVRKGCVLENQLELLINPLCAATAYEPFSRTCQSRQATAVRDAACFVCWALARCFSPHLLKRYVPDLSRALVPVAIFDADVNCRRAAAAAIQEHVGRQGLFPHGIPLVSIANYFALSTMRGAYLAVAPQIAQLQGYQDVLTQHLLNTKLLHSNRYVRELAAQALRRVSFYTPFNDLVVRIETLEQRTLNFESTVNATRHGALLGLSALIDTYERRARAASLNEDKDFTFSSELAQRLRSLVPKLEKLRGYRGRGGELIREGVCRYLAALCSATTSVSFKPQVTVTRYFTTIFECLKHLTHHVQLAAVEVLYTLAVSRCDDESCADAWMAVLLKELENPNTNVSARRGLVLGVGTLAHSYRNTREILYRSLTQLCAEARSLAPNNNPALCDAETRQAAVVSIGFIVDAVLRSHCANHDTLCSTAPPQLRLPNAVLWDDLLTTLTITATDYQVDKRGDVGSWVREVTLEVCCYLLEALLRCAQKVEEAYKHSLGSLSSTDAALHLFNLIIRQTTDKVDRLRSRAAYLIYRFLLNQASATFASLPSCPKFGQNCSSGLLPPLTPQIIFQRVYYTYAYEKLSSQHHRYLRLFFDFAMAQYSCSPEYLSALLVPDVPALFFALSGVISTESFFETAAEPSQETSIYEDSKPVCSLPSQTVSAKPFLNNDDDDDDGEVKHHDAFASYSVSAEQENVFSTTVEPNGVKLQATQELGSFVTWDSYDFATQKFQKSSVVLKLPEFTRHEIIFERFLKLLPSTFYRIVLLEGAANAAGLTSGTVTSSTTALLTNYFKEFLEPSDNSHFTSVSEDGGWAQDKTSLLKWAAQTLVGAALEKASPGNKSLPKTQDVSAFRKYLHNGKPLEALASPEAPKQREVLPQLQKKNAAESFFEAAPVLPNAVTPISGQSMDVEMHAAASAAATIIRGSVAPSHHVTPNAIPLAHCIAKVPHLGTAFRGVTVTSILRLLGLLLLTNWADVYHESARLLPLCYSIMTNATDLRRLRAAVDICCAFIGYSSADQQLLDVRQRCFQASLLMLAHAYPVMREYTCKQLYTRMFVMNEADFNALTDSSMACSLNTYLQLLLSFSWWTLDQYNPETSCLPSYSQHHCSPGLSLSYLKQPELLSTLEPRYSLHASLHQLLERLGFLSPQQNESSVLHVKSDDL